MFLTLSGYLIIDVFSSRELCKLDILKDRGKAINTNIYKNHVFTQTEIKECLTLNCNCHCSYMPRMYNSLEYFWTTKLLCISF